MDPAVISINRFCKKQIARVREVWIQLWPFPEPVVETKVFRQTAPANPRRLDGVYVIACGSQKKYDRISRQLRSEHGLYEVPES